MTHLELAEKIKIGYNESCMLSDDYDYALMKNALIHLRDNDQIPCSVISKMIITVLAKKKRDTLLLNMVEDVWPEAIELARIYGKTVETKQQTEKEIERI
jgi:hypothetical protein